MSNKYSFRSKVWKYDGKAGWYFVTLPMLLSKSIRKEYGVSEEGWGRLKATAKIGKTGWNTAIWYDTKAKSYLLPLKAEVRKKEFIKIDTHLNVSIQIESSKARKGKLGASKPKMWS